MIDGEKLILFTMYVSSVDHWKPVKVQAQVVMTIALQTTVSTTLQHGESVVESLKLGCFGCLCDSVFLGGTFPSWSYVHGP